MSEINVLGFSDVKDLDNCAQASSTPDQIQSEISDADLQARMAEFEATSEIAMKSCAFPIDVVKTLIADHPTATKLLIYNVVENGKHNVYLSIGDDNAKIMKRSDGLIQIQTPCCKCCK